MYKKAKKHSKNYYKSYGNRDREITQEDNQVILAQNVPNLRRVIEITDYDQGVPMYHKLEMYKTDRIDCYKVLVDGKLWKKRIGWSNILAGIRKALPRLLRQ